MNTFKRLDMIAEAVNKVQNKGVTSSDKDLTEKELNTIINRDYCIVETDNSHIDNMKSLNF